MISISQFLLYGFFVVLGFLFFKRNGNKKLPPGPMGLPILGNLLQLGPLPHLKLKEWVKAYGEIFQIKMVTNRVIIISNPKIIREAFNHSGIMGRMDNEIFTLFTDGKYGLTNTEGEAWMEQRRFTMRTLRDLGFGKKSMEGLIMDEVNDFMTFLKANERQPTSLGMRLNICILNCIWAILTAGNRLKHDDERFQDLFERQKTGAEKLSKSFFMFAPRLAKMFPNYSSWNSLTKMKDETHEIFKRHVKDHKETFQDGSEPRDFIDAYLSEMKTNEHNPQSSFYKEKGESHLNGIMFDFFLAGPDTTSSTLAWTILYLSKYPHIQRKVQAELDNIVGKHRQPTLADRPHLPYICATMEEVLRHSSIVPLGVFHRALEDVTFYGYDIPKGAWIGQNHYYMQTSEDFWDSPNEFQPGRHLSLDQKILKPRHEANLPFGVGRRACVGESLARDAIYLFIVTIFQKYNVKLSAESQHVTLDAKPGFVLSPQDYTIVVTDRT